MELKCCPHTDDAIANDKPLEDVPAAVTIAPSMQSFTVGGQQIAAAVTIPVCAECRARQLGLVSKTGLVVA